MANNKVHAAPRSSEYDYLFKLLLIGDAKVGKSSFLNQFQSNEFYTNYTPTIGVDFAIKTIQHGGSNVKLQIWDTAGDDRFRSIVMAYFRGAQGIIVMFDITSKSSFDNVTKWIKLSQENAKEDVKMILVGNKIDMEHERQVELEGAEIFAAELGIPYYEVSSKVQTDVIEAVSMLTSNIYSTMEPIPKQQDRKDTAKVKFEMYPTAEVDEKEKPTKEEEGSSCCVII